MKKKILVVLLLLIPFMVNAKEDGNGCDYSLFVEYQKAAMNIEYETSYSMKDETFSITFYNIVKHMHLNLDNNVYTPMGTDSSEVTVSNLQQGKTVKFAVNTSADNTNCNSSLRTIAISLPYYNKFYGSDKCKEYKNKLTICSSKFLEYKTTEDLLDSMIENYTNSIPVDEPEDPDANRTIFDDIIDFTINWGIEILLVAVSSGVTIFLFNTKLRKIKHGI